MSIKIIAIGKLKEKYLKMGISEYEKRLGAYTKFEILELPDEKIPDNCSPKEQLQILEKEGQRIFQKISPQDFVVVLAIEGNLVTSEQLAQQIESCGIFGKSRISFIIGGSLGLSDAIKKRADVCISFGRITLPHQLMRLVLCEQIYRSFRIIHNQTYHK